MLIPQSDFQVWSPEDIASLRARGRFWRIHTERGARTVRCRSCGEPIRKSELRLNVKRFNLEGRMYDRVGYCHVSQEECEKNLLVNSCIDQQVSEVEKMLIDDPSLAEEL